jgi:hypothetical protein
MEKLTTLQEGAVESIVALKETPAKLAITEQEKYAVETFNAMFGDGVTELYSETSSPIRISGIGKQTEPYMNVNLPNVGIAGKGLFREENINKIYMPKFENTDTYAFYSAVFHRGAYFPMLTETKSNDFTSCTFNGSVYLPNIAILYPASFARLMSAGGGYLILKNPPALSSVPTAPNWSEFKLFIPLGKTEDFEAATNWNSAMKRAREVREATTYEADYEEVWKMLIEDGHLTEEEIRRDFYAEI